MFKKFLAYLLIIALLLPALPVQAEGIYKMVGSGAVTQQDMKISAVNGTTFIDFSDSEAAANKLINHKGYLLKVRDSSKRAIQGYVKAAGTGETFGAELVTNGGFDSVMTGWTLNGPGASMASIAGGVSGNAAELTGANNFVDISQLFTVDIDALYKWSVYAKDGTVASVVTTKGLGVRGVSSQDLLTAANTSDWVKTESYWTATQTNTGFQLGTGVGITGTILFDSATVQKVLTPSATGVTIASTKGGSTFNFAALDSAFNYNDASGYTFELWQVNNAVEVASGSIAAGEMLADTTATNAHVAPVGVNLSAFQTGKYVFAAYNTVGGYAAFGYIKGTAPGGETLGAEIVTNGDFSSDTANWVSHATPYECTLASIAGGQAGNCLELTESGAVNQSWAEQLRASLNVSSLYKLSGYIKSGTSGSEDGGISLAREAFDGSNWLTLSATTTASWSQLSGYYTLTVPTINVTINKLTATAGTMLFDTISFKNVTDCAATGALIVSAKDGATRAWAYKHASFNPNIASTYKIFYTGD